MADFERNLRKLVDERMSGKIEAKEQFSQVDVKKLTLVDTSAMDESVLSSNIIRVVENQCESELRELNRGVGYLLGRPDLETSSNPLAPTTIVEAFTQALHGIGGDRSDQADHPEGAQPDFARRYQRDLRRPESAPRGPEDPARASGGGDHPSAGPDRVHGERVRGDRAQGNGQG